MATLSPARALRKPRRLDLRVLFGILLALVAAIGSIAYWTISSDARSVLVATRDLGAGSVLKADDLAVARVRVDDAIYAQAIPADELESLVGRPLAEPVHPEELLVRAQVSSRPPLPQGTRAMTIAVSAESAAGGDFRPGDAVEVLVTRNKGKPDAKTEVVLPRVTVFDVAYEQSLSVVGSSETTDLSGRGALKSATLVVSESEALRLAEAKWDGDLDVLLLGPDGR